MSLISEKDRQKLIKRKRIAFLFSKLCALITWTSVLLLAVLLYQVSSDGFGWVDWQFLSSFPSRFPERAGIKSAIVGTLWLIGLVALISIPVGVSSALYLEEFAKPGKLNKFIEVNISNLAGVPSIVYGILGLAIFVRFFALERSLLSGALTMSLLILPVIIIASREAIRSVPMSIRYAAFSLGATRWQTTWAHVLPASFPGIMTGVILALSRAIGETAPLIMIGALTFVAFLPAGPMDSFTAMPIQIYNWVSRPQQEFHDLAAAGIIVLLIVLLLMNATAIYIRNKTEKRLK
ncbi:MAG: phosphate ABC transporter, permease protein PstA [Gammaproteobacteria bacterium]|nr:phosphate ABC transporter, permease protein PstA [Gammaproteobacteria bacterium]MAY01952.1 phosphate ABC transporter, permease protein PstA [Gammaproteobacteria bacterium]|tara:strand:- start:2361 stop:3239 length:879 start_codon:yes stop_codon:yes gene_type:complete